MVMCLKKKNKIMNALVEIEGIIILNLVDYLFGTFYKKRSKCHHWSIYQSGHWKNEMTYFSLTWMKGGKRSLVPKEEVYER